MGKSLYFQSVFMMITYMLAASNIYIYDYKFTLHVKYRQKKTKKNTGK